MELEEGVQEAEPVWLQQSRDAQASWGGAADTRAAVSGARL